MLFESLLYRMHFTVSSVNLKEKKSHAHHIYVANKTGGLSSCRTGDRIPSVALLKLVDC